MKATIRRCTAFAVLLLAAAAAHAADTRENRPVTDFTEVGLSAPVDVHVTGDDAGLLG